MADGNITVRARVRVTLEIDAGSSWNSDCALDQVHAQASREAIAELERVLTVAPLSAMQERSRQGIAQRVRIVGDPLVEAIVAARS